MAGEITIHVGFKRTFQIKPYETQVIEFSVSGTDESAVLQQCSPSNLRKLAVAYQAMQETGDAIIEKTLANLPEPQTSSGIAPSGFSPVPSSAKRK